MPALTRQSADVRISEVALPHLITQNSQTTLAAVYVSDQGPVGPTFFSNYEDAVAAIGKPRLNVSFDGYCLRDYFREGSGAWLVRALTQSTANADVPLYGAIAMGVTGAGSARPGSLALIPVTSANPSTASFALGSEFWPTATMGTDGTPLYLLSFRRGPSAVSGTVSVRVRSKNLEQPTDLEINGIQTTTGLVPSGTQLRYGVAAMNENGQVFSAAVNTITLPSSKNAVKLGWPAVPGAYAYVIFGRVPATPGGPVWPIATVGSGTLTYTDDGSVTPATDGSLFPRLPSRLYTDQTSPFLPNSQRFYLDVFDSSVSTVSPVESIECSVNDQMDETSASMETAFRINSFSRYLKCVSNTPTILDTSTVKVYSSTNWTANSTAVTNYVSVSLGTGRSGAAPTAADINAAWAVFSNKEAYPFIDVLTNNGRAVPSIQQQMDAISSRRGDLVAFLDTPQLNQSAQSVLDYRMLQQNINSSYSAMFCSDLLETDPITSRPVYVPPSGAMAGLLARATRTSYPYRSIAGLNRGLVNCLDIRNRYEEADATRLAQSGVNYMRKFLGKGIPLWEQFTLSSAQNALQFLNVRILCNVLKRSLYDYLLYALQEPNDDILRRQITYGLEQYLDYVKGTRGISKYQVLVNSSNNPSILVSNGVLQVTVVIWPLIPVRAINLTLVVSAEGIELSETEIAALS